MPDIDSAIQRFAQVLELCQTENISRINLLTKLAATYAIRYEETKSLHDIDLAIKHQMQAIALAGADHEDKLCFFFRLAHIIIHDFTN